MIKVLTAAQMREVDRLTTERYGIPSIILMENAAHAVARVITEKFGGSVKGKSILILCGKGNNGGDGAALARILAAEGASVRVGLFAKITDTHSDARSNFEICKAIDEAKAVPGRKPHGLYLSTTFRTEGGVEFTEVLDEESWHDLLDVEYDYDGIVDALFGSGFSGKVNLLFATVFENLRRLRENRDLALADSKTYFFSIDVPSGISADLVDPIIDWVDSDFTVTFTAPKASNVLPPAHRYNGELVIASIGTPDELVESQPSQTFLAEASDVLLWLDSTKFNVSSYKNKRGHVLLIAGSADYSGAAVLAANAAMRSGVGLVTLACPANVKAEIASRLLPEVILTTIESDELAMHIERADSVAVGCGLDVDDAAVAGIVRRLIEDRTKPIVVDAGALSLLQRSAREQGRNGDDGCIALADARASATDEHSSAAPLILTPHEGEFLRLLGTDDKSAIKDRVAAVRDFATTHNVILVLKGERVLIGAPDGRVVVNPTGNSGLGKAGNGDTLAGILVGFVAQAAKMNIDIFETVVAAVYIAGMAGDIAEQKFGKRVMTASDVRECLVDVFRSFGSV